MPVFVAKSPEQDTEPKSGKPRRHIFPDRCGIYKRLPSAARDKAKGTPNTDKLQERTVRCEDPNCWTAWEKEEKERKDKGRSKGTRTATQAQGGKAQSLAEKAKNGRQKQPAGAGSK